MKNDCKARIIPHPSQTEKPEAAEDESGEASVGTVLAALTPSNPKHETKMDVNEFHNIYAHSHEGLLRTTVKRLGTAHALSSR